jgi:hypothetical protein
MGPSIIFIASIEAALVPELADVVSQTIEPLAQRSTLAADNVSLVRATTIFATLQRSAASVRD